MKKTVSILLAVCVSALLFIAQTHTAFGQLPTNCNDCELIPWSAPIVHTYYHPDFPTCPLTMTFQKRECNGVTEIKTSPNRFEWDRSSPACSTFFEAFINSAGNFSLYLFTVDLGHRTFALSLFEPQKTNYPCPPNGNMNCNEQGYFQVNMKSFTCVRFYRRASDLPIQGNIDWIGWEFCGDGCCIHATKMCYDPVTQTPRFQVCAPYAGVSTQCSNDFTTNGKPSNAVWATDCVNACSISTRYKSNASE